MTASSTDGNHCIFLDKYWAIGVGYESHNARVQILQIDLVNELKELIDE